MQINQNPAFPIEMPAIPPETLAAMLKDPGPIMLAGVNLDGFFLRDVKMHGASLAGALMRNADLRGADLSDANMIHVKLDDLPL
jgi:uncharacterized protein YjbI with pentapeptide repeats